MDKNKKNSQGKLVLPTHPPVFTYKVIAHEQTERHIISLSVQKLIESNSQ